MLLKPSQNDDKAVVIYGSERLKEIQRDFNEQFFKASEVKFSSELTSKLLDLSMDLKDGVKTRKEVIDEVHNIQSSTDGLNYRVLSSVANCVQKLRSHPYNQAIGEIELTTSILDPILSPLLHDPDNGVIFKWNNTKLIDPGIPGTSPPDSNFVLYKENTPFCSLGFGEVKSAKHSTETALLAIDLVRIAVFAKYAIDTSNVKCVLGFQAVGTSVVFYICTLQDNGLYVFGELVIIKVPDSYESLPAFISYLSDVYRVIHVYYNHCVPGKNSFSKRPTLQSSVFNAVLKHPRDNRRICPVRYIM